MRKYSLIIFIALLFYGCSEKTPISEDKFILVYTDLIIAQDTSSAGSSGLDSIRTMVYGRHEITREEYTATLDYYNEKPERWELFFSKVLNRLEEMQIERAN